MPWSLHLKLSPNVLGSVQNGRANTCSQFDVLMCLFHLMLSEIQLMLSLEVGGVVVNQVVALRRPLYFTPLGDGREWCIGCNSEWPIAVVLNVDLCLRQAG